MSVKEWNGFHYLINKSSLDVARKTDSYCYHVLVSVQHPSRRIAGFSMGLPLASLLIADY